MKKIDLILFKYLRNKAKKKGRKNFFNHFNKFNICIFNIFNICNMYKKIKYNVTLQNRIASLDKDNNPTTSLSKSSSIGMSSYSLNNQPNNMANISELNENSKPADQQSPLSNESSTSSTSTNQQQTQQQHQQSPPTIFLYSAMGSPSQEDLVGNNVGSCDPLFSAHSEELIDIGKLFFIRFE